MSNELSVLIQNNPGILQTGLDEDTLAVAGGSVNTGNKRISIRGKAFRKVVGGKEVSVAESNYMDVIIVKMSHTASRTFYAQAYKDGEKISPTCWSSDSRTPDADVQHPQAKTCESCRFSAKNSGANGTGTACRLSWRLAVVLPTDPNGDVMQLVLPATSCFGAEETGKYPFRPYIQMLANNNISAGRVITRMQFDPKTSTPKVLFAPVGVVNQDDLAIIQRQAKAPAAESAVKLTVYQTDINETETGSVPAYAPVDAFASGKSDVEETAEPVVREPAQTAPPPSGNASEIMKKWSVKG